MAVDPLLYVSALLIATVLTLVIVIRRYNDKVRDLRDELARLSSSKQSLATTYGRITEQWAPFMAGYPHDPRNFRFLGSPVDGVQFEQDRIVFVEFKTNNSRLTPAQQHYRDLVQQGRVEWLEFRVENAASPGAPAAGLPPTAPPTGPRFTPTGADDR